MNPLPGTKGRAHRRPDDEHRLFTLNLLPCLFCFGRIVKTQGCPLGVGVVESSANPGMHCYWGISLAAADTRGGEYNSLTTAQSALERSLL